MSLRLTHASQLCGLKGLEFLDLGCNRLASLPQEIVQMTTLKVLSVEKNKIEELPATLADMVSLQRLKLLDNPIRYPPPEILHLEPLDGVGADEMERAVTANIRQYFRRPCRRPSRPSLDTLAAGPDPQAKLAVHPGPDTTEPNSRPGAAVSRSRSRRPSNRPLAAAPARDVLVQTPPLTAIRPEHRFPPHPDLPELAGCAPVTPPEDQRPGHAAAASVGNKGAAGIVAGQNPAKSSDEVGALARNTPPGRPFSRHSRGASYGSATDNAGTRRKGMYLLGTEDAFTQRPVYVRGLAAVPVRRPKAEADAASAQSAGALGRTVLEVAKGVLFAFYHVHLGVQTLMGLCNDGSVRRSSLEMVFYNTNVYFEDLDMAIRSYENMQHGHGPRSWYAAEAVQRAYATLLTAYMQVCSRLMSSVDVLLENGDGRYVRTFAMQIYQSIMELRVATATATNQDAPAATEKTPRPDHVHTSLAELPSGTEERRLPATTPNLKERRAGLRTKANSGAAVHLRIATDTAHKLAKDCGTWWSETTAVPSSVAPPAAAAVWSPTRSRPVFSSSKVTTTGMANARHHRPAHLAAAAAAAPPLAPAQAEAKFLATLRRASDLVLDMVPDMQDDFSASLRRVLVRADRAARSHPAAAAAARGPLLSTRDLLHARCDTLVCQAEAIQRMLHASASSARAVSPALRARCHAFFASWAALGDQVRAAVRLAGADVALPAREGLQVVARAMRDAVVLLAAVP